jgi:hypothetical protein
LPLPNPLGSTDLSVVGPLSPGGQPLYRHYEVLEREVAERLSPKHAALFAEPQVGETQDLIDWYGPPGRFHKLADLPETDREKVRTELSGLFKDLSGLSDQLAGSSSEDDRFLARLIDLALRIPSEDSILCGPDGPVLLNWGTLPRGQPTSFHVLRILHDQEVAARQKASAETQSEPPSGEAFGGQGTPPPEPPAPGERPLRSEPGTPASQVAIVQTGLPRFAVIASVLLSLLLVLSIGGLLLTACGIALPSLSGSGTPLLTFCDKSSRTTDMLLTVISGYENEIAERSANCTIDGTEEPETPGQERADGNGEPAGPGISGRIKLVRMEPAVGNMCGVIVCESGLNWESEKENCMPAPDLVERIRPQVPENLCRYFLDLQESTVPPGTRFTAEIQYLINDELHKTWQAEGITYPKELMTALRRNGRPRLYWVTDFEWPPTNYQPNQDEE